MKLISSTQAICLIITFHLVGLLLFSKGYLLNRTAISTYSSCPAEASSEQHTCTGYPRKFERVLWVIIDALRHDFTVYDETLDPVPLYRNKLPYIRDLLRDQPKNARLYRFYADAPTTTLQRLKALSTGSLPTFIDFSLNFKGQEITEDSLPHQMAANNKTATFLGDDTWIGLYPQYFNTVLAFPSFNVKDLHTVDNGVIKNLIPELKWNRTDWTIGHFLGVDHCGHTFGPSHPSMADKLKQMNEFLKVIIEHLDDNTIMFVFGDHGMTRGGDHGGESYLETGAALFVYSPRQLFCGKQEKDTLSQIDLVPTVSFLLDTPIPYSNLGAVIADVMQPCGGGDEAMMEFLTALTINSQQINDYLQAYSKISDFPSDAYRSIQQLFNNTMMKHKALSHSFLSTGNLDSSTVQSIIDRYYEYMYGVKQMCISVWARFDETFINQGLAVLVLGILVNLCSLLSIHHPVVASSAYKKMFPLLFVVTLTVGLNSVYMQFDLLGLICVILFVIFVVISLAISYTTKSEIFVTVKQCLVSSATLLFEPSTTLANIVSSSSDYVDSAVSFVILICSSVAILSNSFIIHEGWVLTFFVQTLILFRLVRDIIHRLQSGRSNGIVFYILTHLVLMACVRSSELFWVCREELILCQPTHFVFPFAMARLEIGHLWSPLRLVFSCLFIITPPVWLLWWLRHCQVWSSFSYTLKVLLGCLGVASLCICAFWIMQGFVSIKQLDQLPHWQHVFLPRIVYMLCILTLIKCIHESCMVGSSDQATFSPVIGRAYHLVMTFTAWMILAMLFHDGFAFAALLLLLESFLVLHLHFSGSNIKGSTWSLIVLWYLMMVQLYYATGHQPTLTGVRLEAGFVGQHGDMTGYKLVLAGLLVGLQTIAAQIILAWMVPQLTIWRCNDGTTHKLFSMFDIRHNILRLLLCHTIKLFCSVLGASIHRRHLMVWGVYAPRFLYESWFTLTTDVVMLLSYGYITLLCKKHHPTKLS